MRRKILSVLMMGGGIYLIFGLTGDVSLYAGIGLLFVGIMFLLGKYAAGSGDSGDAFEASSSSDSSDSSSGNNA